MRYKKSRYNIIINRPGGKYLWNTYSNAFIKLDTDGLTWLDAFDGAQSSEPYFKLLEKQGCIVPQELNEIGKVLYEEKMVMLDRAPKVMHFTIVPGMGCNYNCPYCFEKENRSSTVMSQEMIEKTEEYIIQKTSQNPNIESLSIRWFGGEPLLYMDAIEHISRRLISWCERNDIRYSAGIVTNGRYLTIINTQRLNELKVGYVQLSMDGMGHYYEVQKGAHKGDFDAVVSNLKTAAEILDITVRVNITDSLDEALALTDYLLKDCGLNEKIKIYVAHVRDYEGMTAEEEQTSHSRFLEMEGQYIALFGGDNRYSGFSLGYIRPVRRCTTCKTVCDTNYCIGPEGELYRCEHHFGQKDYVVGNITSGRTYINNEIGYLKYSHPKQCLDCRLFPVCLGGCMNDNKDGKPVLACDAFMERQIDYLLKAYGLEK